MLNGSALTYFENIKLKWDQIEWRRHKIKPLTDGLKRNKRELESLEKIA